MKPFILCVGLAFFLMACTHAREQRIIHERKIYKQVMGQELSVDVFYNNSALEREGNPAIAFFHGGGWSSGERREEIWSISPYHNLKPGMPPAIEFHGTADSMVNFWIVEYFKEKTLALGNRFEQIPFEAKGHYLAENDTTYATYFDESIMERTDRFLEELGIMPDQSY